LLLFKKVVILEGVKKTIFPTRQAEPAPKGKRMKTAPKV